MSTAQKFTGLSFDASKVKPQEPFSTFPKGDYPVAITDGEIKATSDGTGKMFAFEITVLDGAFKGRKVFDRLNVENNSAKAQEIAQQQLSAICHATGVMQMKDIQQLFNKPFTASIGLEAERHVDADGTTVEQPAVGGKTYEARNIFKGAKFSKEGATAATTTAASLPASATPAWANKASAKPAAPAPAATEGKKPKAPGKPASPANSAPAVAAPERKFFAFMPDESMELMTETQILAAMKEGMPPETMLTLEADVDAPKWKPASEWNIAAPAPAAETPAGSPVVPPWLRNKK